MQFGKPGSCWPSTFRPEPTIPTSCRIAWWRSETWLQPDAGAGRLSVRRPDLDCRLKRWSSAIAPSEARKRIGARSGKRLRWYRANSIARRRVLRRSAAERKSHDKGCRYSSSDGKISGPDIEGASCGVKPAIMLAGHFPLAPCRRGIESRRFDVLQDLDSGAG